MIDELIASSVADGCDCVINLAAGLDTRPYRLDLPSSLRWVEVDLPPLIERKQRILHAETPNCQVIREAVDLADSTARRRFLDQQRAHSTRALVLSEGLLHYLHEQEVQILAADLTAHGFDTWAFDLMSPATARKLRKSVGVEWESRSPPLQKTHPLVRFSHTHKAHGRFLEQARPRCGWILCRDWRTQGVQHAALHLQLAT